MGFDVKKLAAVFRALGDENRVKILGLLSTGEKCACKLLEELEITQPTLSHHMKILCDSGIVIAEKQWKWTHYSINCQMLGELMSFFDKAKCRREK